MAKNRNIIELKKYITCIREIRTQIVNILHENDKYNMMDKI